MDRDGLYVVAVLALAKAAGGGQALFAAVAWPTAIYFFVIAFTYRGD